MGRLGLAAGHSFLGAEAALPFADRSRREDVSTAYGDVAMLDAGDVVVLQRHGLDRYRPPHLIDHRANMAALAAAGCDRVLAVSSVGSLRTELAVGTIVCPDDFIALQLGYSAHDDMRGHRVPGFDRGWRSQVIASWGQEGGEALRDGGTYWQAVGPRFETPAEIRLMAAHADVVGMTVASECIVADELGLAYAAVCMVDNLANGIGPQPLTAEEFEAGRDANRARVLAALERVVPVLVEAPQ
jgi:5'-methylthioadenosine phosphorylase